MARMNPPSARPLQSFNSSRQHAISSSSAFVYRLSSQAPQSASSLDKESFVQLLQGVLAANDDPDAEDIIDTDAGVNQQLIVVILNGVVQLANTDDPFIPAEAVQQPISDAFKVVELVIRKTPDVLFLDTNFEANGNEQSVAPIFVWVTYRLLSFPRRWRDAEIEKQIWNVLSTMVEAQSKCSRSGTFCASVSEFLQVCATELMNSLRITLTSASNMSAEIFLAGVEQDLATTLRRTQLQSPIVPKKALIGNPSEALYAVLMLLDISTSSSLSPAANQALPFTVRRDINFALDSLGGSANGGLVASFLSLVLKISSAIASQKQKIPFAQRANLMLAGCGASLLNAESVQSDPRLQSAIRPPFLDILKSSRASSDLASSLEDTLFPAIINLKSDRHRFSTDLQDILDQINPDVILCTPLAPRADPGVSKLSLSRNQQISNLREGATETSRPRKRLRLSRNEEDAREAGLVQSLIHQVYNLFGSDNAYDLGGLSQAVPNCYDSLSKAEQCQALQLLGRISCAGANTLQVDNSPSRSPLEYSCSVCDTVGMDTGSATPWTDKQSKELFHTLNALIGLRGFQKSAEARIVAMFSLRRFILHASDPTHSLGESEYGRWCLQSLRSSVRELRIAAGRTLATFLQQEQDFELCRSNRVAALEVLQGLLMEGEIAISETSLLAMGQIAQVCGDDEINIILIKFVEHLGHGNPYLNGLAYNQLLKLAQSAGETPAALLRPFWRTVAVTIVKNLQNRPQIAEQVSTLMGMQIPGLLEFTESYTLPYLFITHNRDVVGRIAQSHGSKTTIKTLFLQDDNLPAILALLLAHSSNDPETTIMSLLREFSEEFDESLAQLIEKSPIRIAYEILKSIGDAQEGKSSKAHQAFRLLSTLTGRDSSRRSERVGDFFEVNVLGIVKEFTDTITDAVAKQPTTEKKRCLKGIGAMVKLGKGHIAAALPQISACLRSAMDHEDLCDPAFHAWSTLIYALDREEVYALIDQTFSMIVQYWKSFSGDTRGLAQQTVAYIFEDPDQLRDMADSIPSFASIPVLAQYEEISNDLKDNLNWRSQLYAYVRRCQNENAIVVSQALTELVQHLEANQGSLHQPSINELPDPVVSELTRAVLDCCVRFNSESNQISILCAQCLGLIGCLDPNRIEATRAKKDIIVLSNFSKADETIEFILFFLQEIVVNAFLSAHTTRAQGFLALAMQRLLKICDLDSTVPHRSREPYSNASYRRWLELPEFVRNTLTPFLTSRYTIRPGNVNNKCTFPLFQPNMTYQDWLQRLVLDLLQKGKGDNTGLLFDVCSKIIKYQDTSIPTFLLPYTALNVIVDGTEEERQELKQEFLNILSYDLPEDRQIKENTVLCSESIFHTLDYFSRWRQDKKKLYASARATAHGRTVTDFNLELYAMQMSRVDDILNSIPAEIISKRAVECKSFARALFHWEQYIRQQRDNLRARDDPADLDPFLGRLQEIYTEIDEPDGIEGISAQLQVPDIEQQILEHQKAGRWTAAQNWYEIRLNEDPHQPDVQLSLAKCLKESGQYDALMGQLERADYKALWLPRLLPFAIEAAWATSRWDKLEVYLSLSDSSGQDEFNVRIGAALLSLRKQDKSRDMTSPGDVLATINNVRLDIVKGLTVTSTSSLQACHDVLLKLHVLHDLESIVSLEDEEDRAKTISRLNRRLDVLGGYSSDKQYVLGLTRAAIALCLPSPEEDIAPSWVTSARLARKSNSLNQALDAVLHASRLGSIDAVVENARLLWREGRHRKATQALEGVLGSKSFQLSNPKTFGQTGDTTASMTQNKQQKMIAAKAQLLLAKWLDHAGQTSSDRILAGYRAAIGLNKRWEKGHFSLGKYYNKLLDSEKAKPPGKQAETYTGGEIYKLVIENYLRSMPFGFKYVFQSLPKVLTLWMDLASTVEKLTDLRSVDGERFEASALTRRKKILDQLNSQIIKYKDKSPTCSLYTAFPQIVARICHNNIGVQQVLTSLIVKIVYNLPQQSLWTLLAVAKSSATERKARGDECLKKILEHARRTKSPPTGLDLKALILSGQKLSDELLRICEIDVSGKASRISLSRDLQFNHKLAPCKLVVPIETTLIPSLPPNKDPSELATHEAFPKDTITISTFLDDVVVLSSLQKPRKISVRGSNGRVYGLLCKPKDDLRKDQRLMEFNTMINRFLKRDDESSKRKLYIKTYAVTPLNEECGLIEWVDNLKTLRDILLKMYKDRNVAINYNEIRMLLDEAAYDRSKIHIFQDKILAHFRPVFFEWFIEMFPEPSQWFAARLKYTRSAAVMSVVGHVLGLGDRHGENILFEEDSGGTLHVDFNCLFDKGLTFEKPELVPFRLTHNMVDAFGAYGYNGPFRKSCELALGLLRSNEDALMTVLETFLYDPTTDFIGKKKRSRGVDVPDTPAGVLDSVRTKLRGLLKGESVPLSVGGYVEWLILQATDHRNLAAMYIGWCAFF